MFKLSSTFIGLTAGATMSATLATAQELPEAKMCQPATTFNRIECDTKTREPIIVFNECAIVVKGLKLKIDPQENKVTSEPIMGEDHFYAFATVKEIKDGIRYAEENEGIEIDPVQLNAMNIALKKLRENPFICLKQS